MNDTEFSNALKNSKQLTFEELQILLIDNHNLDDFKVNGVMRDSTGGFINENIYLSNSDRSIFIELSNKNNQVLLSIKNNKSEIHEYFTFGAELYDDIRDWFPIENIQEQMLEMMLRNTLQLTSRKRFNLGA